MDLQDTSLALVAIFAFGGLAAWLSAASFFVRRLRQARAVAQWRQVDATIVYAKVVVRRTADGKLYEPQVRFSYRIAAREFVGEQLRLGARQIRMASREAAERALRPYRSGERTQALCDPGDPSRAVLEAESYGISLGALLVIGLALFIIAIFLARGA